LFNIFNLDAKRMLKTGTLRANEAELTLSSTKDSVEVHLPEALASCVERGSSPFVMTDNLQNVHTIQITNVPNIPEHYLKLALEKQVNDKVDCITVYPERSRVVVKFKNPKGNIGNHNFWFKYYYLK
jgi:hypothetical protein